VQGASSPVTGDCYLLVI